VPRPIQAFIHSAALAHNLRLARSASAHSKLWAVVKADAYGHRLALAFEGLRGADGFALLDFDEAIALRGLGWRGPILLLEGCFEARDLELCSRLGLWHVIHCEAQIDWLASHKTLWPHQVFLKMNSGLNRLGFSPSAFRCAYQRLAQLTQVEQVVAMTHFANADTPQGWLQQQVLFDRHAADLHLERSLCNSAAQLCSRRDDEGLHADWVRPGVMLYGASPDFPEHGAAHWGLQPAMSLRSALIAVQELGAGSSVGYGGIFTASHAMRIGVVACGYADGYPRHAPTGTPVLVEGVRTRVVGRVSMDMLTVDLTPLPSVQPGAEVTLWGCAGNGAVLPIDEVAHSAGTISYELMCALAPRVRATAV
jgi:alanine racemase